MAARLRWPPVMRVEAGKATVIHARMATHFSATVRTVASNRKGWWTSRTHTATHGTGGFGYDRVNRGALLTRSYPQFGVEGLTTGLG